MSDEETTMIDIYEAGGAEINEERTEATIRSNWQSQPFDIVLRVIPTSYEMNTGEGDKVTFGVILDPEHVVETTGLGAVFRQIYFDESVTLPIRQVRILKREQG